MSTMLVWCAAFAMVAMALGDDEASAAPNPSPPASPPASPPSPPASPSASPSPSPKQPMPTVEPASPNPTPAPLPPPQTEAMRTLDALNSPYLHFHYGFRLGRQSDYRQGNGEMWLWRDADGLTHLATKAEAHSTYSGNTQISMTGDPKARRIYLLFHVEDFHEAQCVWFPFPDPAKFKSRMALIRRRQEQVAAWSRTGRLKVGWTKSTTLEVREEGGHFDGVEIKRGGTLLKTFELKGASMEHAAAPPTASLFEPPSSDCQDGRQGAPTPVLTPAEERRREGPPHQAKNWLATVELVPPHHRSSALNDLLLVLQTQGLPTDFVTLSAMAVPGDTALVIEDPPAPRFDLLKGISFNYNASVFRSTETHKSNGSMSISLLNKSFHIYGKAAHTVLGDLNLDFVAFAETKKPTVYANVELPVQARKQCLYYDYPNMPSDGVALVASREKSLSFFMVDEIDDEDCGIFMAELPRGRHLYIWVVMEQDDLHSVLRTEITHREVKLRRADIFNWRHDRIPVEDLKPRESWKCRPQNDIEGASHKLAEMGITDLHKQSPVNAGDVHKRSLELLDALYALKNLRMDFAIQELLALPGDVSIVVSEPQVPDLIVYPSVAFNYTMSMHFIPSKAHMGGYFIADLYQNQFRLTAGGLGMSRLDVIVGHGKINVQIQPVYDAEECPDMGFRAVDRCWYLSKTGESCRSACANHGLQFAWAIVNDGQPMIPNLLGKQPSQKDDPWGRLECYVEREDRYHPAQVHPADNTADVGDLGNWKYYTCQLACPCSPMVHTEEKQCMSIDVPEFNSSTTSFVDGSLSSFDRVGSIGEHECNIFSFPARREAVSQPKNRAEAAGELLMETSVDLWYSEEDAAAHMILLRHQDDEIAELNVSHWEAPAKVPDFSILETPASWECKNQATEYEPWLQLAESKEIARLYWENCGDTDCPVPASAALWQLAEAVGVLSIIHPKVQDKLSRVLAWPVKRPSSHKPKRAPLDLFDENLEAFSFNFYSTYPQKGSQVGKAHGTGKVRVDLKNRRMTMSSEAKDISKGLPLVESHMVYFDQHLHQHQQVSEVKPLLVIRNLIDTYNQCWSVLGNHRPKPAKTQNPFLRAKHIAGPFSAPTTHHGQHSVAKAEKYLLVMDYLRKVELFVEKVGGKNRLVGMNHVDSRRDTTSFVVITDWSTEPLDEKEFDMWDNCEDTRYKYNEELGQSLDDWDLVTFFFPDEAITPGAPGLTIGGSGLSGSSTATTQAPPRRAMGTDADDELITV